MLSRYVYIALIVVLTASVLLFKLQNLEQVTVRLLSPSFTLPVSVLLVLIYVLEMLTGARDYADAKTRGIAQVLEGYDADPFGGPPR